MSGAKATPLPLKQLFVLSCILVSEGFSITMLFPFIPFMVRDFKVTDNEAHLGYYVGLVAGSFSIAQFISSFLWGRVSDSKRVGRRPVLLIGLAGSFISMSAFGFSQNLAMAVCFRALNGLLNGNIGISKTYLAEITDETNQASAFSVLGLVWGVGSFFGPVVGGFLARPAHKYPGAFPPGSFFSTYPYALPCLVAASVTLIGFLTGLFFLPESHPGKVKKQQKYQQLTTIASAEDQGGVAVVPGDEEGQSTGAVQQNEEEEDDEDEGETTVTIRQLLSDGVVVRVTLSYAVLGLVYVMMDEVMPMWAMTPVSRGGVNFGTNDIGIIVAVGGVSLLFVQLFLYSPLVKRLGYIRSWRVSLVGCAIVFPVMPMTTYLARGGQQVLLYIILSIIMIIRNMTGVFAFTSVAILINHSVRPRVVGSVNGLGQSMVALFRAVAPFLGGSLYAWSISKSNDRMKPFPFNHYLVFFLASCMALSLLVVTARLPATLEKRKGDSEDGHVTVVSQSDDGDRAGGGLMNRSRSHDEDGNDDDTLGSDIELQAINVAS